MKALLVLLAVCLFVIPASAKYSGGTGEPESPYQIATTGDLMLLGESPEDYDKHFIMTADIDLDPNLPGRKVFNRAVIAPDINNVKTYFQGTPFTGSFHGNGHTISHLTIAGGGYLGLFGLLGFRGQVRNLGVVDINIPGLGDYVGGLVGSNSGTITNCYIESGNVSGVSRVGGLIGSNRTNGKVMLSYSAGLVSGQQSVGGLVGSNSGTLNCCYSSGAVGGEGSVGGLVGDNYYGNIATSYSTSAVNGDNSVGGLVGINRWNSVSNSYSTGAVHGGDNVGGLIGRNWGYMSNCYSTGATRGDDNVGGLVGNNYRDVTCCFWDTQTSDLATSSGGKGLTTAEMQMATTFLDVGWDFVDETANGTHDIWWILEGQDYPKLRQVPEGLRLAPLVAFYPDPKDGAIDVIRSPILSWAAGKSALYHEVYFGEEKDTVTNATPESPGIYHGRYPAGMTTHNPGILEYAKTYYWRIDEVNEVDPNSPWKGDVWSFTISDPIISPNPADGAIDIVQSPILGWIPARPGLQYDIYFADDEDAVANATPASSGIYKNRQPSDLTTYDPNTLELNKTYYWRIDAIDEADPNSPWKGHVWNFTTADYILVLVADDFERYDDHEICAIWHVWIDGWINGTGSQVGYIMPPFAEQRIVHGGWQSMPFFYDNDGAVDDKRPGGTTGIPFYSEAVGTFESPWNWTINDADTLTLYFRGRADNDPDYMYVGIEDRAGRIAIATHPDADALLSTEWQKWRISFVDMQAAGVDLTAVLKIYIGVGDRDNPKPGGSGKIYIDDILVTNSMP